MPPSIARTPRAIILARMAWVESGAHVTAQEVAAFDEVITTRMRQSYTRTAWGYSVGLRNQRRAWVHRLGRSPLGSGYAPYVREEWPRVLEAADQAVSGEVAHGCRAGGPLVHWGGPRVDRSSLARLERRGYARAECPGFFNVFLYRRTQ